MCAADTPILPWTLKSARFAQLRGHWAICTKSKPHGELG